MILKNSEEKRNTAWRTVMTVSSVLIVIIAAFFIVRLFTANPLKGIWVNEEEGIRMEVQEDDSVVISWSDSEEDGRTITLDGTVDKKNKTFTIQEGKETEEAEDSAADSEQEDISEPFTGTYSYSIEQDTLTLTEREYGDQIVFQRK